VAVGLKVNSLKLLAPVNQKVVILQKSLRHTPAQKLQDAFIAVLAGAHGLSEINTRVRSDISTGRPLQQPGRRTSRYRRTVARGQAAAR